MTINARFQSSMRRFGSSRGENVSTPTCTFQDKPLPTLTRKHYPCPCPGPVDLKVDASPWGQQLIRSHLFVLGLFKIALICSKLLLPCSSSSSKRPGVPKTEADVLAWVCLRLYSGNQAVCPARHWGRGKRETWAENRFHI